MSTQRRSQADRSRSTRSTLIATARRLFTERGYADVPADEVVRAAGLTRGALYHHYRGKQELFRDVFEQLEEEVTAEVAAAAEAAGEHAMAASLAAFLDVCQRPDVVRIALTDAPAVLGWPLWREIEAQHGLGLVAQLLGDAHAAGILATPPTPELTQLVFAAVIEAALLIAHADDPAATRRRCEESLLVLLSGLSAETAMGPARQAT